MKFLDSSSGADSNSFRGDANAFNDFLIELHAHPGDAPHFSMSSQSLENF